MKTRVCNKCNKRKKIEMFYFYRKPSVNRSKKCKECTKADVAANRLKHIDRIRQYDRDRGKLPHRKERCIEYTKKRRLQFPGRYKAHTKVGNAIRDGKLNKPVSCSNCNKIGKVVGHHHDYRKPLEVVWLCQICHKQLHRDTF